MGQKPHIEVQHARKSTMLTGVLWRVAAPKLGHSFFQRLGTPASVGESQEWTSIVSTAEENRGNFCKALSGKTLYTVTLNQLKGLLKASISEENETTGASHQDESFQEVRRRTRHNIQKIAETAKKAPPSNRQDLP
jgi:hypothetical protein